MFSVYVDIWDYFHEEIGRVSSATSAIAAIFHFLCYAFALGPSFTLLFSSCRLNRISKQFITPTPGAHLYPYRRSLVAPCKRLLLQVEPPTSQQPTLTSGETQSSLSLFLSLSLSFSCLTVLERPSASYSSACE